MTDYNISPRVNKLLSPMIIWIVFLFSSVICRIILELFTGMHATAVEKILYSDMTLLMLAAIWHAWVWRKDAYFQASLIAAIEWPVATTLVGYLWLRFLWSLSDSEIVAALRFWDGGAYGLLVVSSALAPLILGPAFGLAGRLKLGGDKGSSP
nr:hypothetical protein [Desulfuromonadales bacterium]